MDFTQFTLTVTKLSSLKTDRFLVHHNIIYTDTDSEEIDRQNTQQELDDADRTTGHRGMHLQLS